jgi:phage terminase small subunit
MGLSKKQQAFVEFYLQTWNATEAAKRAGYSRKTAYSIGSENLTKPEIKAAIDARLAELKMSSDEVMIRLSQMARGDMRDFMDITHDGKAFINLTKAAKRGKLHLIKEIEQTRDTKKIGDTEYITETFRVKLHDAMAALQLIGKHHKLFSEKVVIETWRDQAIADIRAGKLPYEILEEEFGDDLATELFRLAGVPIAGEAGDRA